MNKNRHNIKTYYYYKIKMQNNNPLALFDLMSLFDMRKSLEKEEIVNQAQRIVNKFEYLIKSDLKIKKTREYMMLNDDIFLSDYVFPENIKYLRHNGFQVFKLIVYLKDDDHWIENHIITWSLQSNSEFKTKVYDEIILSYGDVVSKKKSYFEEILL